MVVPNCTIPFYEKSCPIHQQHRKTTSEQTLAPQMEEPYLPQKPIAKILHQNSISNNLMYTIIIPKKHSSYCTVIHDRTTNQEKSEWNHSRIRNSIGAKENYQKDIIMEMCVNWRNETKIKDGGYDPILRLRIYETLTLNYVYFTDFNQRERERERERDCRSLWCLPDLRGHSYI